jgi:hypothetical protein
LLLVGNREYDEEQKATQYFPRDGGAEAKSGAGKAVNQKSQRLLHRY